MQGIINAKRRGLQNLICATVQDAAFTSNSLPAIGVFDVVEHVEDDMAFLSTLKNCLQNQGKLYQTVPAYNFLWSQEDEDAGHFRRYTLRNLRKTLKIVGFKVEYSTYFFSLLPAPIFLLRTLPSIFDSKRTNNFAKNQAVHNSRTGLIGKTVNSVWKWELNTIERKKIIPFGSRILAIAQNI